MVFLRCFPGFLSGILQELDTEFVFRSFPRVFPGVLRKYHPGFLAKIHPVFLIDVFPGCFPEFLPGHL